MFCMRLGGGLGVILLLATSAGGANYRVTFEATWSAANHPDAYPPNAHFSTPIGTTHNVNLQLWAPGELASPGIEGVAETGSVRLLREEIATAIVAGDAFGYAQGATFNSPGSNRFGLEAVEAFPFVSIVSMIAPSPDWFVGVHDVPLRDEEGWREQIVIDLVPYDAGTESGNAFSLSNPATDPLEVIRPLDSDPDSILFGTEHWGTLTFDLLADCDFDRNGSCDVNDLNRNTGLYSVGDLTTGVTVVPGVNSRFDLNPDGVVDGVDLDVWLAMAAAENGFAEPYLRGDTNLNDHVGFGDFIALSRGFGTGVEWTDGNYDGSERTDFADFLALSGNYGRQIRRRDQAAAVVPEPAVSTLLFIGLLGLQAVLRRRAACSG